MLSANKGITNLDCKTSVVGENMMRTCFIFTVVVTDICDKVICDFKKKWHFGELSNSLQVQWERLTCRHINDNLSETQ